MRALVVYESMYGNTHEIAEAIAEGLAPVGEVQVGSVAEIPPESVADGDLIVLGGPTHVHGMSRASSRKAAVEAAEEDDDLEIEPEAGGAGLREWLGDLPKASPDAVGAAFDTRIDKAAILTGSAAKGIAKQLRRHGYTALADAESFFVDGSNGPLKAGEADRAREWGRALADRAREWGRALADRVSGSGSGA